MIQRKHIRYASLLFLLTLLPFTAFAQSSNGSIVGNVTDNNGGSMPGVTVTVANIATNATRTVVTNSAGHYEIPLLMPATYRITAELSGFQNVKGMAMVNVGSTATFDIKLRPAVSETVTVTAAAPVIETTKSEASPENWRAAIATSSTSSDATRVWGPRRLWKRPGRPATTPSNASERPGRTK